MKPTPSPLPCERCPVSVTIETNNPPPLSKDLGERCLPSDLSYPILDEKGNLISVIEYAQDITEEQQLQEQLIQSGKIGRYRYIGLWGCPRNQ